MTQSTRAYFGTDGIRGPVGEMPITPEFVLKLGWAIGRVLVGQGNDNKVIIGKDTRLSGYMLESALVSGLSAAGVNSFLLGPMPTPAVAYLTRTFLAQAGVVISASHNPYQDNGLKFFSHAGKKLPDEIEVQVEAELAKPMTFVASDALGKATRIKDAPGRYIEFCKSAVPSGLSLAGIKIVVDCANGATYHIAPNVFRELGATVIEMGTSPNGININNGCGSTAPEACQKRVLAEKADLGITLDGDGDRLIMVDHKGDLVDGDQILFIITKHYFEQGMLRGGVVGTQMSNMGLEAALTGLNIPFLRSAVGDRYVLEALVQNGWQLGGESSGHIICLGSTTTGDGIVAALQVLTAMSMTGESLHNLKQAMPYYPRTLINVKVTGEGKAALDNKQIQEAVQSVEASLKGQGRVLLRPSGTEPVVRVMVEGQEAAQVDALAKELAGTVESVLAG